MSRKGSFALGFAKTLAEGLANAPREEERKQDRADAREERQIRLGAIRREEQEKISLANAARPTTVEEGAGGAIRPETMDNRDVGQPGEAPVTLGGGSFRAAGKTFTDKAGADQAAAAYNNPNATIDRVAQAQMATDPVKGITLQNAAASQRQAAFKLTKEQEAEAKKLKDEGVLEGVASLRRGDAAGMVEAFNKSGKFRIEGQPVITQDEREIPGVGKVPTYSATFTMRGADGQPKEMKVNSHDLSMQLMPYEKALELQRKGTDSDNKAAYQSGLLDTKIKQLELTGQIAEARALAAAAKATAGGGALGKEERLRYTSLMNGAARSAENARKALGALQGNPIYSTAKPGSTQAEELNTLRETLKDAQEERQLYAGLLADPKGEGKKPLALGDAKPSAGAEPVKVGSKAERDKLPKGARYIGPDGQTYVKQ